MAFYESDVDPIFPDYLPCRHRFGPHFKCAGHSYFWISDYNSSYKDSVFSATFNLEKVVPDATLEKVVINLGNTAIVDNTSKIYEKSFTALTTGANTLSLDLKSLSASDKSNLRKTGFVFARIGVKTKNVTDLIYSKVEGLKN